LYTDKYIYNFEKLDVYNKALNFIYSVFDISKRLPYKFQSSLGDQLRRASLSIVNNIAEGSDKISSRDKKNFYSHSLNSSRECIPMFTICLNQNLINKSEYDKLRDDCTVICKMLRKLIDSVL
jgi:four helix bundle protein